MTNKLFRKLNSTLSVNIPSQYTNEFINECVNTNIFRVGILSTMLLIINILFLITDIKVTSLLWSRTPAYRYLFYSHIFIVTTMAVFIPSVFFAIKKKNIMLNRALYNFYAVLSLSWCAWISINGQNIHQQITIYIVGVFCAASFLLLTNLEVLFLFPFSYALFTTGLILTDINAEVLFAHILNAGVLLIFAYIISRVLFSSYAANFINNKIINEKNAELQIAKESLEKNVAHRTNELNTANELLIKEISARHKAELETVTAKLQSQEKSKLLSEAVMYNKLKTEFFANISHEFRTPLNIILCAEKMIDLIVKSDDISNNQEKLFKHMSSIKTNCLRLVRLVGNLVDLSKMDSGYLELQLGNYDIVKIVEDITLSAVDYAETNNINLTFDTEIEEKVISCDPEKIERIMLNLLSNAVKFTPDGGNILVKVYESDNTVFISVKDSGIGIPREKQPLVFERFVQVDKSLTRRNEGSGLGLSIVKSLVELNNGAISLISEPGEGSEFIIELPANILSFNEDINQADNSLNEQNLKKLDIEFSDIYAG